MTNDLKNIVANTAIKSTDVAEHLDQLVNQVKTDVGAPFEPDALDAIASVKNINPAEYERLRVKLKQAGFNRLGELDKALERLERESGAHDFSGQGNALQISDAVPYPEPVDGAELLEELTQAVRRHVVLSEEAALAIALWVIFTYVFDVFFIAPILAIQSPEKGCGKTTLLDVLAALVSRPLSASNITFAALFRTIEAATPTLLIDEADTFAQNNDELRGILNSGHRKGGAVIRTVGENHTPQNFATWCPKVIASIRKLPDTLQDRSIVIPLQRKRADEKADPFRGDRAGHLHAIASMVCRWALDNRDILADYEPEMPACIFNRTADNCRPLLAIAEVIGGTWAEKARSAMLELNTKDRDEQESFGIQILADIREIFSRELSGKFKSDTLSDYLRSMEGRPWADWNRGKGMVPTTLANLLKPFGIKPSTKRFTANDTAKGYERDQFIEAWTRYLPPQETTEPSRRNNPHQPIC
ncbi:MAG: DUF3631 domain-containing protein [Alphaproteobacteria bacterium]|nr:DUF3631 domain-containing protein [Alphaproteobacteria bacterium]